jgi:hypothetical protein
MYAPKKVVRHFLFRGNFERANQNTLGIESTKHIPDHSIFSTCIHTLQYYKHGVLRLCIK